MMCSLRTATYKRTIKKNIKFLWNDTQHCSFLFIVHYYFCSFYLLFIILVFITTIKLYLLCQQYCNDIPASKKNLRCSIHWWSRAQPSNSSSMGTLYLAFSQTTSPIETQPKTSIPPFNQTTPIETQPRTSIPLFSQTTTPIETQPKTFIPPFNQTTIPLKLNQEPLYHHHQLTGTTTTDNDDIGSPKVKHWAFNHTFPIIF